MFTSLDIGTSGLEAQRARLDAIAFNMANLNSTRNERGELTPPKRRFAVFMAGQRHDRTKPGVHAKIGHDPSVQRRYDPTHADADATGHVKYADIDMAIEYVNAMGATRAYEANITAMEVSKAMFNATLRLLA